MQLQEARNQFQANNIHQKPNAKENPVQALNKWLQEPELTTKVELNNVSDINKQIDDLQVNINLQKTILVKISGINFKELQKDLETVIIKPNSRISQVLLSWINKGIKLHKITENGPVETKKCLFCGNTFNSEDVASKYFPLLKSEYSKWINRCSDKMKKVTQKIWESLYCLLPLYINLSYFYIS